MDGRGEMVDRPSAGLKRWKICAISVSRAVAVVPEDWEEAKALETLQYRSGDASYP